MQQQPDKQSLSTKIEIMKEQQQTSTKKMNSIKLNISLERTAVQWYCPKSKESNSTDHVALKSFNKILRNCKNLNLLLKDRQKFQVLAADFLPFNYNENSIVS